VTSSNVGRTRRGSVVRKLLWLLLAVCVMGVIIFPVYWALVVAMERSNLVLVRPPTLLPLHPVAENFLTAIKDETGSIATSLVVAFGTVVVSLVISIPAAYGLVRYSFWTTTAIVLVLLVAQMVPSISLSVSYYSIFHDLHLLNSYEGLILADSTYAVPFVVLVLRAYMGSLPKEVFEAANVDGAGAFRAFRSVAVPLSRPGIITAALFSFLFAWGDFLFAFTLNAGGAVQPLTLGLFKFVGSYGADWGPIMGTVVLAAVPSGIVLIFAQRWISGGLRAGALKG
jgi:multiple sugar transport system permease protein